MHTVILLGIVSLLNDIAGDLIAPILPMFITSLGGGGIIIGLLGGLRDSITGILKIFGGYWSDCTGKRKVFVGSGYFLSSLFRLLLSFSATWSSALVFSSVERIGKGLRSAPRDAIISDAMPKNCGRAFGIHRTLDSIGGVVGSLMAFVLFWNLHLKLSELILIAAILSFLSLVPLLFVNETRCLNNKPRISLFVSLKNLPPRIRLFVFVGTIFALGNFSYMFFVLRAADFFTSKLAVGAPILLYMLFSIFYTIGAIPFGILSDKIGRKWVIGMGYLFFFITCIGFIFVNSTHWLIILFAIYGLVHACTECSYSAFIADIVPPELKSTAIGAFQSSVSLFALPASLIAGMLWHISPALTFAFGGLMGLVSMILIVTLF